MFASKEKRHLLEGPRPGATPGGVGLVDVMARTDGSSEDLLDRCREVLEEILDAGPALWPSVDEWRSSLPQWFVRGCADEPAAEDERAGWHGGAASIPRRGSRPAVTGRGAWPTGCGGCSLTNARGSGGTLAARTSTRCRSTSRCPAGPRRQGPWWLLQVAGAKAVEWPAETI